MAEHYSRVTISVILRYVIQRGVHSYANIVCKIRLAWWVKKNLPLQEQFSCSLSLLQLDANLIEGELYYRLA